MAIFMVMNLPLLAIVYLYVYEQHSTCNLYYHNWLICDIMISVFSVFNIKLEWVQ